MATTYFVVYWLVPRFLIEGLIVRFCIYLGYTLLASLYVELVIIVGLYMTVSDYQALFVSPTVVDLMDVLIGMYVVVFGALSINSWRRWQHEKRGRDLAERDRTQAELALQRERIATDASITLRVDRENVRVRAQDILFVESDRDYLIVHTDASKLITKMTLNKLEQRLDDWGFTRIHRSFLVRDGALTSWTAEEAHLEDVSLPIGRSYRDSFKKRFTINN